MTPTIGDKISFVPTAFYKDLSLERWGKGVSLTLTGTVIHVNEAHRHYTVEAIVRGCSMRETIKY